MQIYRKRIGEIDDKRKVTFLDENAVMFIEGRDCLEKMTEEVALEQKVNDPPIKNKKRRKRKRKTI